MADCFEGMFIGPLSMKMEGGRFVGVKKELLAYFGNSSYNKPSCPVRVTERTDFQMTKAEMIEKLRNIEKAYVLHSLFTKMPFVECEEGNYYDQAYLFEAKEDAEEAAKRISENGDMVGYTELKTVEMILPDEVAKKAKGRHLMHSQVKEHLMKFPLIGLNAVFFKPAGERGETLLLDEVLPDSAKEQVNRENSERCVVQLTGMYLAQYLRRKDRSDARVAELYDEFLSNLARVKLLIPVIPGEGAKAADGSLNMPMCELPIISPQPKTEGQEEGAPAPEQVRALALFTNMDEVAIYSRSRLSEVKVMEVSLEDVLGFIPADVTFCVIDFLTVSITVRRADLIKLCRK